MLNVKSFADQVAEQDEQERDSLVQDAPIRERIQSPSFEDQVKARKLQIANPGLDEGVKQNPDSFVKTKQLSSDFKVNSDVIETDPERFEAEKRRRELYKKLRKSGNATAFLSKYENAAVAHDDVDTLIGLDQAFDETWWEKQQAEDDARAIDSSDDTLSRFITTDIPNKMKTFGASFGANVEKTISGFMESSMSAIPKDQRAEYSDQLFGGAFSKDQIDNLPDDLYNEAEMILKQVTADAPMTTKVGEYFSGAIDSIMLMAPGMALGHPELAVQLMGWQTFGQTYADSIAKGMSPDDAFNNSYIQASAESLTELVPFIGFASIVNPGKKLTKEMLEQAVKGQLKPGKPMGRKLAEYMLAEFPGEFMATTIQNSSDKHFSADPAERDGQIMEYLTGPEFWKDQKDTFLQTAMQTFLMSSAGKTGNVMMDRVNRIGEDKDLRQKYEDQLTENQKNTRKEQSKLSQIIQVVKESKLGERDKDTLRDFAETITTEEDNVYIPAEKLNEFLEQNEIDPDSFIKGMQDLQAQILEAASIGGDIVIPAKDFIADVSTHENIDTLREDLRMSSSTSTINEMKTAQEEQLKLVDQLREEAEKNAETFEESRAIYEKTVAQLQATGRMNDQVAKISAEIIVPYMSILAAKAKENGMDITMEEIYEQSGFGVQGPFTGPVQEGATDGVINNQNTLKQDGYQGAIQGQEGSATTQVATTTGSYVKSLNKILEVFPEATRVLDYGAGLGLGTDAMTESSGLNIESYEPFPERWKGNTPVTHTESNAITGQYDAIVNLNVLNVLEKSIRDQVVADIGAKLAVGGRAVIGTRGFKGDVANAKNSRPGEEEGSLWIQKSGGEVYQKGFDGNELVEYVQGVLGENYKVTKLSGPTKSNIMIEKLSEPSGVLNQTLTQENKSDTIVSKLTDESGQAVLSELMPLFEGTGFTKIQVLKIANQVASRDQALLDAGFDPVTAVRTEGGKTKITTVVSKGGKELLKLSRAYEIFEEEGFQHGIGAILNVAGEKTGITDIVYEAESRVARELGISSWGTFLHKKTADLFHELYDNVTGERDKDGFGAFESVPDESKVGQTEDSGGGASYLLEAMRGQNEKQTTSYNRSYHRITPISFDFETGNPTDETTVGVDARKIQQRRQSQAEYNRTLSSQSMTSEVAALVEAINSEEDVQLIEAGPDTMAGVMYSTRTWTAGEKDEIRQLADKMEIEPDAVDQWLYEIDNAMAKVLSDPSLDFISEAADLYTALKPNSDPHYVVSLDFSTLCRKRYELIATIEAIQRQMGRAIEKNDWVTIREMLDKKGYNVSCGACYVDSKRMESGKFVNKFIQDHPEADPQQFLSQDGIDTMKRENPALYKEFKKSLGANNAKTPESRTDYNGEIRWYFVEGRKQDDKQTQATGESTWSKPNKAGEERGKKRVEEMNKKSGLRWQSWSDFEIQHMMDAMQAILDMSMAGLKGHAYTKVPEFVRAMGRTGLMVNMSLIPKGNGFDANGNLIFDSKEGMDFDEAMKLREEFEDTAGVIAIAISNEHLEALLADPRIDYIIPYHASGLSKEIAQKFNMDNWADFTATQNDGVADVDRFHQVVVMNATDSSAKKKLIEMYDSGETGTEYVKVAKASGLVDIAFSEWWSDSRSGKANGDKYLQIAAERGVAPKFRGKEYVGNPDNNLKDFTSDENYWKLLIDRKSYNHEGENIAQQPVQPKYKPGEIEKLYEEAIANPIPDAAVPEVVAAFTGQTFQQGETVVRGMFDPQTNLIRLTEASDVSTFLHEAGHFFLQMERKYNPGGMGEITKWFLENKKDITDEANAFIKESGGKGKVTEEMVEDFLNKGATGDLVADNVINRAVHEQFARGFEVYLSEGKAPSNELRSAFRSFAKWLTELWKSIKQSPNVNLTDEARQYFDRMLASEEQIKLAEAVDRMAPMFTDAVMDGKSWMTPKEYEAYKKRTEGATDKATETLTQKLIKELTNRMSQDWNDEKSDMIDDIVADLNKQKVYVALNVLRNAEPEAKLDRATVMQILGIKTLPTELTGIGKNDKTAISLEEAAEKYGYDSGKELLDAIIDADPIGDVAHREGISVTKVRQQFPVYSMIRELKMRKGGVKINRDDINAALGIEKMPGSLVQVTSPAIGNVQGSNPDAVAETLGYGSADEMLQDFAKTPPVEQAADSIAENKMIDKYGDILNDGSIEQEAQDAAHNEERGKLILQELRILTRAQRKPPAIDRETLKRLARENIERLSLSKIRPDVYRRAEIKAAMAAQTAMDKGDTVAALHHKTQQAMNFYLYTEAMKARNKGDLIKRYTARFRKASNTRKVLTKVGFGYMDQIDNILLRFEFIKSIKSVRELNKQKREALKVWIGERRADGETIDVSVEVADEDFAQHYKDVPFGELVGVYESLRNIETVGRNHNKVVIEGEKQELKEFIDQLEEAAQDTKIEFEQSNTNASPSDADNKKLNRRGAIANHTKPAFLFTWMDGGKRIGLWYRTFFQPISDAVSEYHDLTKKVTEPIIALLNARSKEDQKRHATKVFIKETVTKNANGDTINDGNYYGSQLISVALNIGNKGNLEKMLKGEGWIPQDAADDLITIDNPQLQAVLKKLSKNDWNLVEAVWENIEQLYTPMNEVYQRVSGISLPKVEASPFKININGIEREFKGGYYPVVYDPNRDTQAEDNESKKEAGLSVFDNGYFRPSASTGATNERTRATGPIRFDMNVVPNHINEVVMYITHHERVAQINKLLTQPRVRKMIKERMGQNEYTAMKMWLKDVSINGRETNHKANYGWGIDNLRHGMTLGVLGFKVGTMIKQLFGIGPTVGEIGVKYMAAGQHQVMRYMASKAGRKDMWEFVNARSRMMRTRINTMDREMKTASAQLKNKKDMLSGAQQASMMGIAYMQVYGVDLPSWFGAYDKKLDEMYKTEDPSNYETFEAFDEAMQDRAAIYADFVIETFQGSGELKDMSAIMRDNNAFVKSITMFMTYFSSMYNFQRDLGRGAKSGQYSKAKIASKVLFAYMIPVFFDTLISTLSNNDDDEEPLDFALKFGMNLALFPFQVFPLFRNIASGAFSGYDVEVSPLASLVSDAATSANRVAQKAIDGELEDTTWYDVKNLTEFTAAVKGVPGVAQTVNSGEHLYDVLEEDEDFDIMKFLF